MSDLEPRRCAETNQLHAAEPRGRQRWRTQRFFDLAVAASGLDPRRVARAMRIDIRSLSEMRELPTLHYIARIAEALGIDAGSAAAVIGLGADCTARCSRDDEVLPERVVRADLDDDATALCILAERLGTDAHDPSDLALSILCSARAESASGEVRAAHQRAQSALDIGISPAWRPVAEELIGAIEVDAVLGDAWMPVDRSRIAAGAAVSSLRRQRLRIDASVDAVSARATAGALAVAMLRESIRSEGRCSEHIAALRRVLSESSERECPDAVAWTASIAGIAALRLRECAALSDRDKRAAMSLFVSAQFAIDERIADFGANAPMPLLRRRLRLALHEWCDRARRGELSSALFDEVDDREVKAMFVRFPRARTA